MRLSDSSISNTYLPADISLFTLPSHPSIDNCRLYNGAISARRRLGDVQFSTISHTTINQLTSRSCKEYNCRSIIVVQILFQLLSVYDARYRLSAKSNWIIGKQWKIKRKLRLNSSSSHWIVSWKSDII